MSEYPELIYIEANGGMLVTVDILKPEIYRPLSNREIEEVARRSNSQPDLLKACEMIENRLLANGEWDDRCFYYAGKSASELEEPLKLIKAALAKVQPSSTDAQGKS